MTNERVDELIQNASVDEIKKVIKDENLMPIGVRTYLLQPVLPQDEYFMMLIFVILPPIIFFCIFQKYIMGGVSLGGVKG